MPVTGRSERVAEVCAWSSRVPGEHTAPVAPEAQRAVRV